MSVARPMVVVAASPPARCIGWCGSKYGGQAKGECYGYQNRYLHWDFLSMCAGDGREPNVWASEKFHPREEFGLGGSPLSMRTRPRSYVARPLKALTANPSGSSVVPTTQSYQRPDGLDQAKRPCTLKEPVDGAEDT
jgi:hypothetical protein